MNRHGRERRKRRQGLEMKIIIPFQDDMAEAVVKGKKTATTRTKICGVPGDTFKVRDLTCELVEIKHRTLRHIANNYYKQEGFESAESFIEKWQAIHPRKGFVPHQFVYLHIFKRVDHAQNKVAH